MRSEEFSPRIVAIAETLLCSSIPTQLLIGSLLRVAGWLPFDETGQLSLAFVLMLSVADTLLLIGLMVALQALGLAWYLVFRKVEV